MKDDEKDPQPRHGPSVAWTMLLATLAALVQTLAEPPPAGVQEGPGLDRAGRLQAAATAASRCGFIRPA